MLSSLADSLVAICQYLTSFIGEISPLTTFSYVFGVTYMYRVFQIIQQYL